MCVKFYNSHKTLYLLVGISPLFKLLPGPGPMPKKEAMDLKDWTGLDYDLIINAGVLIDVCILNQSQSMHGF